jgi:hypothetical protein
MLLASAIVPAKNEDRPVQHTSEQLAIKGSPDLSALQRFHAYLQRSTPPAVCLSLQSAVLRLSAEELPHASLVEDRPEINTT